MNYIEIILIIVAYLLGCINGAYLFSTNVKKEDIRTKGSGNAGASNILRNYGFYSFVIVAAIDVLKGVFAVLICKYFNQDGLIVAGAAIACIAGHNWPVFMGFKGGKGVATTIGVFLAINFPITLICVIIGFSSVLITKIMSIGSMSALTLIPILYFFLNQPMEYVVLGIILALLTIFQHRANLKRIKDGNENKLSF